MKSPRLSLSESAVVPTQLRKPSIQFVVLVVGIVLLAASVIGLSGAGLASSPEESGRLDVEGVSYRFAPSTCTITSDDFLAAGGGSIGGEPFWVSASADRVNLAIGPESEEERPADDQLWLMSVEDVRWRAADESITATAMMRDERDTNSEVVMATLTIECRSA